MSSFLNNPPLGYKRSGNGWLSVASTPQKKQIKNLKSENEDLKARLDQLEEMVAGLVSKKKK
jgi:cell division protein FtsB